LKLNSFFTAKRSILLVLIVFITLLVLLIPKIYFRNNIYYISKDINKLYSHYISLKEENIFLQQQLEDAKFKNQITDSITLQRLEE
jgi:cell division protein FtsL